MKVQLFLVAIFCLECQGLSFFTNLFYSTTTTTEETTTVDPPETAKLDLDNGLVDEEDIMILEDGLLELSDNFLDNLGDFSNLENLEKLLGIEQKMEDVLVFQPPQASRDRTSVGLSDFRNHPSLEEEIAQTLLSLNSKPQNRYISNPVQARCEPELKTVNLNLPKSKQIYYYPTCTRVKRCGGCCNSVHYVCEPLVSEKVIIKVLQLRLQSNVREQQISSRGSNRRRRRNYSARSNHVNVTVEEHVKCDCQCIVKETACNLQIHDYDARNCNCNCKNKNDEEECRRKTTHSWNKDTCQCLCYNPKNPNNICQNGMEFDNETCKCITKKADDLFLLWNNPSSFVLNRGNTDDIFVSAINFRNPLFAPTNP